ncbi:MAG: glycosyltransferase family 2 protein [Boseongicola sp.]
MGATNIHVRSLEVTEDEVGKRLCSTRVGDYLYQSYLSGADATALHNSAGKSLEFLRQIGNGVFAKLDASADPESDEQELALLADRRVLFGFRNGESVAATRDWLAYHKKSYVSGALIFDRSPPGEAVAFAKSLRNELQDCGSDDPVVLIVHATEPMGPYNGFDARRPALAPGAPAHIKGDLGSPNAWHAPFSESVLLESLRRRYLANASAVAFVDVSDLLLPYEKLTVFDWAEKSNGEVVRLAGREMYPWRLRHGSKSFHHDHVYARINERRWLSRWCVAPKSLSDNAVWRASRIDGAPASAVGPVQYIRAMGVAFPGAPVSKLVDKSSLVEDPAVISALNNSQKTAPILRKKRNRAPKMKTGGVTVVTAMKNEGPFILDWLAHNRVIGVDNFLIYTNDCSDSTNELLGALAKEGIVEHRENPYRAGGSVPQHAAFRAAEAEKIVQNASWLLTLDVDEYINIHVGEGRLTDLMSAVPDANVISMPWRLFGSGDRIEFEDSPVCEQFRNCAPEYTPRPHQAWGFKTLYKNTGLFKRLGVHRPRGFDPATRDEINWVDGSGRPMPVPLWKAGWRMTDACWGYQLVTLNHYAVRSAEMFLVKRDRGRVNHVDRDQGLAYWFRMNHNACEDRTIDRYGAKVAEERKKLEAVQGVSEAHANSVAWHKSKISDLLQNPEIQTFFKTISGYRLRKLSRMLDHFGSNVFLSGPQVIPDEIIARDPSDSWQFTVRDRQRQD